MKIYLDDERIAPVLLTIIVDIAVYSAVDNQIKPN